MLSRHRRPVLVSYLVVAVALGATACGDDATSDSGASSDDTSTTAAARTSAGTTLQVGDSELGTILTLADGTTVYLFTPDTATSSECTGGCLQAWPVVDGPATAGDGVDAAALGTLERDDGATQATYHGHPLYTYGGDTSPGEVNGQASGGKWYVVAPDGSAVGGSGEATNLEGRTGDY